MPHKHVKTSETGFQGRTHEDHDHLKMHRLNEDRPTDKSHYMMTWLAEIQVGKPILAQFFGPTAIYIVEGEFHVEDQSKPGEIAKLAAGDVFNVDHGTLNTWSSPNKGKAFAICYAPTDVHPEDMAVKI